MSSQLPEIFIALAGMSVAVVGSVAYNGDKTPQVLYLATLPQGAPDAKLPSRLLRMLRTSEGGGHAFQMVFGNTTISTVTWRIYDVLLWRKVDQGLGIGSHEADLTKYAAAYVEALKKIPAPTSRSRVMGGEVLVGELNYPEGSDYWYAGVEVALDIEERLLNDSSVAAWG